MLSAIGHDWTIQGDKADTVASVHISKDVNASQ